MKIFRSALVGVCVCVLAAVCSAQVLKRTTTKTDTIPLGAGSTVSITGAPVGSIKVNVIPGNDIQITAEIEVQAANEADLAGAAAMTTFMTDESLAKVSIISIGRDSRRKFTDAEKKLIKRLAGMPYRIDYTVGVPMYCDVQADAGTGDISITGPEGNHRVTVINGNAWIRVPGGALSVTVGKGSLRIEVPPSGRLGGGIDASVVTGDIDLRIPWNLGADIDASVLRTGRISFETLKLTPRDRKTPFVDKLVIARLATGGPSIKLTTGDGNIQLGHIVD